jgi:hypothetical protein
MSEPTIPTTFAECLNDRFISAEELANAIWTVRIAQVYREQLASENGGVQTKTTMAIANGKGEIHRKKIVMNRTNLEALKAMWGDKVADWIGKRLHLHAIPNAFRGRPGIRVWGSPDLAEDVAFDLKLPKKSAQRMLLKRDKRKDGEAA